ncbi:MAG: TipAS antibiotic-recognition domain-containing protein, partial [Solirubrobacteraceae bacterium]
ARTDRLLSVIEHEMEARKMGISLTPEEQLEVFDTDRIEEYQREAREHWGDTEAWRESQRRSAAYTKEDWIEIKRQADENVEAFAAAIRVGEPADGEVAMELAEAHRQHISRWFYDCSRQMHRSLGDLYVSDARYGEPYEKLAPRFSTYVRDAIVANAARLGS